MVDELVDTTIPRIMDKLTPADKHKVSRVCGYPRLADTLFVRILCPWERMFIVSHQPKKYTPEYRREAANLIIESEHPIAHVPKEIGVPPGF